MTLGNKNLKINEVLKFLISVDKRIKALIDNYDLEGLNPEKSYLKSLVRSIIFQQLSGRAAETIFNRFMALFPKEKDLNANKILSLDSALMRSVGISGPKVNYIKNVANSFIEKSTHKIYFSSIFKIEIDDFSSSNLFNVDLSAFGTLSLKFNNVDINYVTEFADFNLEKATVKFYPDLGIIEGTNGKIYSDNNLSYLTNINFNLSSFSIDLGKGIILSKEAYLNAKEQKNVKGIFEFIPPKSSPSSLNTFKFTSSTYDIIILSDKQIKITGGIEIEGDKLLTRSQNDESSNLSINLSKGKKINLRSKSFDLSGTKIKSLDTYFVFYDEK